MHREYSQALRWAATLPEPAWPADSPDHLRPDPARRARDLTHALGVEVDLLRPR
jgi:hypothetical protein